MDNSNFTHQIKHETYHLKAQYEIPMDCFISSAKYMQYETTYKPINLMTHGDFNIVNLRKSSCHTLQEKQHTKIHTESSYGTDV